MALCDRLEAVRGERESQRDRLTAASHHYLNDGANAEGFRKHSHFCLNHFPCLTTRPEQIPALRRTILSLAVRGQLVPQNPRDEPASQLLKRIQVEKARLTEDGNIKKDKRAWEGLPKDPPHELPVAWIWTCLQDVFEISRGGSPRPDLNSLIHGGCGGGYFASHFAYARISIIGTVAVAWSLAISSNKNAVAGFPCGVIV